MSSERIAVNLRDLSVFADVTADAELAAAIMRRHFRASLIKTEAWEGYEFADMEIKITESTDCYGAVLWPSVRITHSEKQN